MRTVLFHRDFRGYSGGHGKVYDYYGHVLAHADFDARVHLVPGSMADGNPWIGAGAPIEASWDPETADVLFIGGMDWAAVPTDRDDRPVINLVQGVRHADRDGPLRAFLSRRAIRICVGAPVADAIRSTGLVNGPVTVIEAGLSLPPSDRATRKIPGRLFIGAIKQPEIGTRLAQELVAAGRDVDLCVGWTPRRAYLQRLAAAECAIVLPLEREGFYLPGLEAMALDCATIVPDCTGNRAYAQPGLNALCPAIEVDALLAAVAALDDQPLRERLREAGRATARRFALERERHAFHRLLDDLDGWWRA